MAEESAALAAPYLSYKTLLSFIESLRDHALPDQIDKSLMGGQSGTSKGQLMTCMKFLRLLEAKDRPALALKALYAAEDEASWAAAIKPVVTNAYSALGSPNLETITVEQLEKLFREHYGNQGETLEKAIRFYLKCVEVAKIPYSKRLAARTVRPLTKRTPKPEKQERQEQEDDKADEGADNPARIRGSVQSVQALLLAKFPAFDPTWDKPTRDSWFESYKALLGMSEGESKK